MLFQNNSRRQTHTVLYARAWSGTRGYVTIWVIVLKIGTVMTGRDGKRCGCVLEGDGASSCRSLVVVSRRVVIRQRAGGLACEQVLCKPSPR